MAGNDGGSATRSRFIDIVFLFLPTTFKLWDSAADAATLSQAIAASAVGDPSVSLRLSSLLCISALTPSAHRTHRCIQEQCRRGRYPGQVGEDLRVEQVFDILCPIFRLSTIQSCRNLLALAFDVQDISPPH